MIWLLEIVTSTPSWPGGLLTIEIGSFKSSLCGTAALDSPRVFNKKTKMMVMMSSIAVMFRKLISGSCALRRIALRSAALYVTIDALGAAGGGGPGGVPPGGAAWVIW